MPNDIQKYIIVGAYGGIGMTLARLLKQQHAETILLGRNEQKLQLLAAELQAPYYVIDATDIDVTEKCFSQIQQQHGDILGVANCIGSLCLKPAHLISANDWFQALQTNLTSAFSVVKASAKIMMKSGGSVVLISSAAARIGIPNHEAIAAAKAGILGLVLSAAATYAPQHIRFNAVAPGLIKTPLTAGITNNPTAEKASLANHPLGRFGEPEEVARLIAWLLQPENSWVSGQTYGIDGGLATLRGRTVI